MGNFKVNCPVPFTTTSTTTTTTTAAIVCRSNTTVNVTDISLDPVFVLYLL